MPIPTTPLFDPTLQGLSNALTVHERRHRVLATNIANVETPGYRARDTDFRRALDQAFTSAGAPAVPGTTDPMDAATRMHEDLEMPARADGNTVDIDLQMAKLSDNTSRYAALARILTKRISLLRQAMDGSR
ncbi:MAG TPA: flagellar basal body rod protein FlgB [Candidatus Binatia bacterium]|jgi:flagellar basal-body rod protein FlgB|nr:flagellar basal body rod protein FlgB [Candidatus Binatia bacterium]